MTRKTYCGNILWQSGLTLLATGMEVNVLGPSGMVDLEVRVLGAADERMHFKSKVQ